ncbi:putative proteinase inhibitor I12, Bowman-Birk [Medicago truncatula]|uniref:Bowman birk trypsin inhibitor n=1 Tax=Medicago truncatula TaxID=3880 RepID=G7L4L3_MEDTR|nr:Bowman birk trypsin inhibitor [Medicago truncatula]RHN46936.1 putative proteinase inhibitor I12, Bowman-Birk [Medicago truncatula]
MELNKALLNVASLLFLLNFTATVDARFDPISLNTQVLSNVKLITTSCCDNCHCTTTIPPLCRCADIVKNKCNSACKLCVCKSTIPPQCRCMDHTNFCYEPCNVIPMKSQLEGH